MTDLPQANGLSASALKYLACLFMLIDHIGALLCPQYLVLRCIGRLAFPIFAFMIANGYIHTSNPKKYLLRLVFFALGFQWFYARIFSTESLSILATLALGLAAVWVADILKKRIGNHNLALSGGLIAAALFCALGQVIHVDYGWYGVALIYTAWLFYARLSRMALAWGLINIAFVWSIGMGISIQALSLLALVFIAFYNGQRGQSSRWFFYIFYPAHLIALYLIRILLF